jgi:subtilisin family serine protease
MKKYMLVFFILISLSNLIAQEKYLIYFKDKGNLSKQVLLKNSSIKALAKTTLSKKSIERRKKNLGKNYFTFEDFPVNQAYIQKLEELNIKIINKLKWFNAVSAYLSEEQYKELFKLPFIQKINRVKVLKYSRNKKVELDKKNNYDSYTNLTSPFNYGPSLSQNKLSEIPQVHELGITGENVIIGLLDSGFDWKNRKCFQNTNVIAEYDFVNHDTVTNHGAYGHGTAVFSILAGFDEGELIGPAFNSKFLLAKTEFVPTETHLEEDNYAAALEWMDSIGVDITTSSLGYNEFDKGEESYTYNDMDGKTTIVTQAAEKAFSKGIVVISSAGNEGNKKWRYITAPADGFNVIAVGAVGSDSVLTGFSSQGPTVDGRIKPEVVAQGANVYHEAWYNEGYSSGSGTSYSAPIVAGIAGQLLSAYPHLKNTQVRNILLEACDSSDLPNNFRGYGILSSLRAVTFPNIENEDGKFILNKMFKPTEHNNTVWLEYYYHNDDAIKIIELDSNENGIYKFEVPKPKTNNVLLIAYEMKDESNNTIYREPTNGFFLWRYGEEDVHLKLNVPELKIIPDNYYLSQNFPNPFNPTTTIQYSIPVVATHDSPLLQQVQVKVYNILGKEVATLVNEKKEPGYYLTEFDASNFSSGVYFYRLIVGNFIQTKKMIYLR